MARPVRLGKAASELNVGVQTLIDFLKSKEIAMEFTPNTKLEQEHLEILRKLNLLKIKISRRSQRFYWKS